MVNFNAQAGGEQAQQVRAICESEMAGHEWAVRKVQWSPHRPDVLASASYDMTCRVYVFHSCSPALKLIIDYSCCLAGRQMRLEAVKVICCIYMTRTRSLWWDVRGRYIQKVYLRVVVGIVESTYFVCNMQVGVLSSFHT